MNEQKQEATGTVASVECPDCEGDGWYVAAEHDPHCDGSCDLCPIPVQRECETCGSSGALYTGGSAASEKVL